jgi:hypothetical protein
MAKILADLALHLSTDVAELKKGLDQANSKLNDFSKNAGSQAKAIKNIFLEVAAVIGGMKGSFELVKTGLEASGKGAAFLEKVTKELKAGFDSFAKSVVDLDFKNIILNFKNATNAAGNYADTMATLNDKIAALSVSHSALSSRVMELRAKQSLGTITRDEVEELKKSTIDLEKIEVQIYQESVNAQVKFIANAKGYNAELFSTIEKGIKDRENLSTEELEKTKKDVWDEYDKKYKEFLNKFKTVEQVSGTGPAGQLIMTEKVTTDMIAVNKAMEDYISNLNDVQKSYVLQQISQSPEIWNQLISFMVKRNEVEGEYAGLLRRENTALNKVEEGRTLADIALIGKQNPIMGGKPTISAGGIFPNAQSDLLNTLHIMTKALKVEIPEDLTGIKILGFALKETFIGIGDAIAQAFTTPKETFKDFINALGDMIKQIIAKLIAMIAVALIAVAVLSMLGIGELGGMKGIKATVKFAEAFKSTFKTISMFDSGGISSGGLAMVGESGPELVNLPRGSQVFSNSQSKNMMGGELTCKVSGTDLLFVLNRQTQINNA